MEWGGARTDLRRRDVQRLEQVIRACTHHRRIRILHLLEHQPGLPLVEIVRTLRAGLKATAEHVAKMHAADLLSKQRDGIRVCHHLTRRGKTVLGFLKNLDKEL